MLYANDIQRQLRQREAELCCPVDYDTQYLTVIPQEVIDRDYGCGDPSKWVQVRVKQCWTSEAAVEKFASSRRRLLAQREKSSALT